MTKPEDITVDADKFDRILSNMLKARPLSKAVISERVKARRAANPEETAKLRENIKKYKSKKLGQ